MTKRMCIANTFTYLQSKINKTNKLSPVDGYQSILYTIRMTVDFEDRDMAAFNQLRSFPARRKESGIAGMLMRWGVPREYVSLALLVIVVIAVIVSIIMLASSHKNIESAQSKINPTFIKIMNHTQ